MIKKIVVSLFCLAGAVLVTTSCRSSKDAVSISALDGEWNITEINGSAVVPATGREYPSIGFETTTGKINGNSGCNRMMGSFDNTAKDGVINLGQIASTKMFCTDMVLEQNVLNALKNVKGYRKMGNNRIALTNSFNRPVMVLTSKLDLSAISSLEGEWEIAEINGEAIPDGLMRQPFLAFDTAKKSIHGNTGCNMINGGFTTDTNDNTAITFPAVAATMMACPDMAVERKVLDALNRVKSFSILTDKSVGLYDGSGTVVLLLTK